MKIDLYKIIQNILLLVIMIILIFTVIILQDYSKNGRYLPISDKSILDTRTGKPYQIDRYFELPFLQEQK